MSVCPSVYLFTCMSALLKSAWFSVCLLLFMSTWFAVDLPACMLISLCPYACISACLTTCFLACLPDYPPTYQSVRLPVYLSACLLVWAAMVSKPFREICSIVFTATSVYFSRLSTKSAAAAALPLLLICWRQRKSNKIDFTVERESDPLQWTQRGGRLLKTPTDEAIIVGCRGGRGKTLPKTPPKVVSLSEKWQIKAKPINLISKSAMPVHNISAFFKF